MTHHVSEIQDWGGGVKTFNETDSHLKTLETLSLQGTYVIYLINAALP